MNLEDFSSIVDLAALYSCQFYAPLTLLAEALKPFDQCLGSLLPQPCPYGFDFGRVQATTSVVSYGHL